MNKMLIACITIAGIVAIILTTLKGSLGSFLPWLLILVCLLIHIFMMRGMNNHKEGGQKDDSKNNKSCH